VRIAYSFQFRLMRVYSPALSARSFAEHDYAWVALTSFRRHALGEELAFKEAMIMMMMAAAAAADDSRDEAVVYHSEADSRRSHSRLIRPGSGSVSASSVQTMRPHTRPECATMGTSVRGGKHSK
jgi:hypothetical protein